MDHSMLGEVRGQLKGAGSPSTMQALDETQVIRFGGKHLHPLSHIFLCQKKTVVSSRAPSAT